MTKPQQRYDQPNTKSQTNSFFFFFLAYLIKKLNYVACYAQVGHAASVLLFTYCQQSQRHKQNMSHLQPNKAKECVARTGLLELGVKKKIQISTNPDDRTKLRWGSSVQVSTSANAGSDGVLGLWVIFYVQCKQLCATPASKPQIESRAVTFDC